MTQMFLIGQSILTSCEWPEIRFKIFSTNSDFSALEHFFLKSTNQTNSESDLSAQTSFVELLN